MSPVKTNSEKGLRSRFLCSRCLSSSGSRLRLPQIAYGARRHRLESVGHAEGLAHPIRREARHVVAVQSQVYSLKEEVLQGGPHVVGEVAGWGGRCGWSWTRR